MEYWGDLAREYSALFITLQESHLTHGVMDAEIDIPNHSSFRADREQRKNGGVISYIRQDLGVRNQFSHSNSYCVSVAQYIPDLNLCLINLCRPPNCPTIKFEETLDFLDKFLLGLEGEQGSPTILCTGDMNLPFVKDWSRPGLEKFCAKVAQQERSNKTSAEDKKAGSNAY